MEEKEIEEIKSIAGKIATKALFYMNFKRMKEKSAVYCAAMDILRVELGRHDGI